MYIIVGVALGLLVAFLPTEYLPAGGGTEVRVIVGAALGGLVSFIAMIAEFRWVVSPPARAESERALDVLTKHGMRAHWYAPEAGVEDPELADACRFLGGRGFLITDASGGLVGKVATARPTSEEMAQQRRARFRLIEGAEAEQR